MFRPSENSKKAIKCKSSFYIREQLEKGKQLEKIRHTTELGIPDFKIVLYNPKSKIRLFKPNNSNNTYVPHLGCSPCCRRRTRSKLL